MKGEMGWENVKLGIVENEPVSETFRKRTNARKCWLNSDKELNHLSTVKVLQCLLPDALCAFFLLLCPFCFSRKDDLPAADSAQLCRQH